ncbi:MAG: class II aldolase/adducin family protein [Chloroflexi bacterium]|nr:class II aldolase/adducin family protein [Chloroflexota bacterium]
MAMRELKQEVLRYARQMMFDGLARGSQGNVSAIDRASGLIAITPSAADYSSMTEDDIVVVNAAGDVVEGRWKPTIETPLHTLVLRRRPDVGAVVHCHAPHVSGFAAALQPIPLVLAEAAACVGHEVPCAPFMPSGTAEFAALMLDVLGRGNAAVMGQHGLLTCGADLRRAYAAAVAVEDSARACIHARSLGFTPQPLPPQVCAELHQWWRVAYRRKGIASSDSA